KIYQVKNNQTLFLEGLVSMTFQGEDSSIVLYVDRNLNIHKTNESRVKDLLRKKDTQFKIFAEKYEEKSYKVPKGKYQITIADMGFVHLTGPMTVKTNYPKGMHMSLTEALFQ